MSGHTDEDSVFNRVALGAIGANLVIAIAQRIDETRWLELADDSIIGFFAFELMYRLKKEGLSFFRSFWNATDAVIIVACVVGVIMELTHAEQTLPVTGVLAVLRLARYARYAHLLRHSSHLRLFRWFVGWNNKQRHLVEFKIKDGKIVPVCFYCEKDVPLKHTRINRLFWVYGNCCGDKRVKWAQVLHG
jgi:hypothetical protein